jgi:hypothetical protein
MLSHQTMVLISGEQNVVYSNRNYAEELWKYCGPEVVEMVLVHHGYKVNQG